MSPEVLMLTWTQTASLSVQQDALIAWAFLWDQHCAHKAQALKYELLQEIFNELFQLSSVLLSTTDISVFVVRGLNQQ